MAGFMSVTFQKRFQSKERRRASKKEAEREFLQMLADSRAEKEEIIKICAEVDAFLDKMEKDFDRRYFPGGDEPLPQDLSADDDDLSCFDDDDRYEEDQKTQEDARREDEEYDPGLDWWHDPDY